MISDKQILGSIEQEVKSRNYYMNNIDRTSIGLAALALNGCKSVVDFFQEDVSKISQDGVFEKVYVKPEQNTQNLEDKTQEAPIEVPEVKQPEPIVKTNTNYNNTDLTIAGAICAGTLIIYTIGKSWLFWKKHKQSKLSLQQPDSKE